MILATIKDENIMNLYKALELVNLERFIDQETGEIDIEGFNAAKAELHEKMRAVVAYIKNQQIIVDNLSNTIKDLQAKKEVKINKIDSLKDYLKSIMIQNQTKKIEATDGSFYASLSGISKSVIIEDDAVIPTEYLNDPKPPEPSKTKLKAALESGMAIDGVYLKETQKILIK